MAKTSNTTRGKKRTPAKTAAKKTARTTRSAAAKPNVAASKAKKPSKPVSAAISSGFDGLRKIHLIAAAIHAVQGVAIIVLSKVYTLPLTLGFLAPDTLRSTDSSTVWASAEKIIWDINLAYALSALFFISAVANLLAATVLRKQYNENLKTGVYPGGWLHHGLANGLVFMLLAALLGLQDLGILLAIFGLAMAGSMFALVFEMQNKSGGKVQWFGFKLASLNIALIWIILGLAVLGSFIFGMTGLPVYVYVLLVSVLVICKLTILQVYARFKKGGKWADAISNEKRTLLLSLALNAAVAWQLYAALLLK